MKHRHLNTVRKVSLWINNINWLDRRDEIEVGQKEVKGAIEKTVENANSYSAVMVSVCHIRSRLREVERKGNVSVSSPPLDSWSKDLQRSV